MAAAALSNSSSILGRTSHIHPSSPPANQRIPSSCFSNVSFAPSSTIKTGRRSLLVRAASSSNVERSSTAPAFVGGFILGGLVVGALGCVYAPQISKVLAADRKDLMRKLPKFIYDEEKALEKTRKILTEKIAQLNSAIDDISTQLRSQDSPNGAAVSSDELETAI
ncbi:hypothetical protein Droror1_Dr00023654 [Drosera rotundifolia]